MAKRPLGNTLIIFIKYPKPGLVKTRLAKTIGKEKAAFLYKKFVELILRRTQSEEVKRLLFYTPGNRKKEIIKWLGKKIKYYPQQGRNLGERLSGAFKLAFKQGARRAVVIGSDSPLLDSKIILKAFKKLQNNQCVIGPAYDGGYYLLGLSAFYKEIFNNIDWGTDKVFKQTLYRIKKLRLKLNILEEGFDVDEIKDLKLLISLMPCLNQLLAPL